MTASSNSRIFLLLFLATLAAFGPFVTDFYLPTLPEQTTDFHTSPAMVQLGLSNIMWGLAAGQLLVGPISDRRGRKKPLFWCLVLFAVTTAVAAAATEIHVFLVMRFFEGLGAAGAIVLSRSIAADRYTGRELGSFMGVMGAIQGIAPITAPMLGALIADAAGWRGIFWILFGTGVVLAFITLFVFVETLPRSRIKSAERSSSGTERESIRESSAKLIADPVFCGIVFQQLLASGILFGHISSSPFIFRGHFDLSPELYGLTFGLLALGITAGAVISSRIDPLKAYRRCRHAGLCSPCSRLLHHKSFTLGRSSLLLLFDGIPWAYASCRNDGCSYAAPSARRLCSCGHWFSGICGRRSCRAAHCNR